PGTKIYPKGSLGKLIGYNEELLSYRILAEDGRIMDTKSVQFLVLRERTSRIKPAKYTYLTGDPTSFKKAVNCKEKEKWIQAADDKLNSIEGHEFDVKAEFLYAPLKETISIKTPEGSKRKAPFLRLKKSLYGLKQAPANWFETLTSWLRETNYNQSSLDPCLFIHKDSDSFFFFHVDNLIVAGKVQAFEDLFLLQFPNSSAHEPDTLLGMELNQKPGLELLGMEDCKPVLTPLSPGIKLLTPTKEEKLQFEKLNINYRNLAPAVSMLSSFNNNPGIKQWQQILHCWKYLKGTMDLKLTLHPESSEVGNHIRYFTDATWADDLESRLSRSGTICFWKLCPVSWNSKKQNNISLSSTEAELNALSDGVQESQWIFYLIEELWN
ncbi:hypothetical protein VP01_5083g2, partial [Puccinia sorghi]